MAGAVDARIALETRLNAIASPLVTQFENTLYEPIAGTPYQQVFLMLATPANFEYGSGYQENGYLQVTLRYPRNSDSVLSGAGPAQIRAQAIRDWFYRGLSLTANGLIVNITKTPAIGPAFNDNDRYCVPVKIPFTVNN